MTPSTLSVRPAAQRRPSSNEPSLRFIPAKHQAPLCWGCFLPIFGNRPEMFDGDLRTCSTEDDENPFNGTNHEHPANYLTGPCCSNLLSEHDTCGLLVAPIDRETGSPLVTIPSPVSCEVENEVIQETSPYNEIDAEEAWEDNELPELLCSDTNSVQDPSSVCSTESYDLEEIGCSHPYTGDITNCDVVSGIEIQAVLHQAGMRLPFAATIPFPCVGETPLSRPEARSLLKEQKVLIVGQLQVGAQKIPFQFPSVI